jgi:uncharacterized protein with GYD domain
MGRYLFAASYTADGAKGVLGKGGSARRTAVEKAAAALGGRMETFDFAFGDDDVYTICELPDNAAAASFALTVSSDPKVSVRTVVLVSPEEIDEAAQRKVDYVAPGS